MGFAAFDYRRRKFRGMYKKALRFSGKQYMEPDSASSA
jgi:hypothetical protein